MDEVSLKNDGLAHLRKWVGRTERSFGDPKISVERRVHLIRVAGKRLRALLLLTRGDARMGKWPRRHGEAIRRAANALSPYRDAAVTRELLAKCEQKERSDQMLLLWKKWRAWRQEHVHDETVPPPKLPTKLLLSLEEAEERIGRWMKKRATPKRLLRGWEIAAQDLREGAEAFFAHPENTAAHAWRKQMKELWFQTEWLREMGLAVPLEDTRPLERLSAALGRANDLAVLQEFLWEATEVPWAPEERLLLDGHLETLKRKAWHRVGVNWRKILGTLEASKEERQTEPSSAVRFSPPVVVPPANGGGVPGKPRESAEGPD